MEILKEKKKIIFIKFTKFFLFVFSSILLFLSFRSLILFSSDKLQYFLIFLFYIFTLLISFYKKNIFFTNFSVIIILNFLLTPFFLNNFFDIPYRQPNTKNNIFWQKDLSSGFVSTSHTVTTDIRGNRVNREINYDEFSNKNFRALAFGASTTEEQGLDDKLIWTNNLINFLEKDKIDEKKNYEMINFGISGTRTIHHYLAFKRNLSLKPDLIIFLVGVNDWNYQIIKRREYYLFPSIEIQFGYNYSFLHDFSSKFSRIIKKRITKKNINIEKNPKEDLNNPYKNFIKKNIDIKNNISGYTSVDIKNVSQDYAFWINKIIKLCKTNKLNCIFADQPSLYHIDNIDTYKKKIWMNPPFEKYKIDLKSMINIKEIYNSYLKEELKKNNLVFCSLSSKVKPIFSNFIDDVHFSPNGSKLVAKTLFECVKRVRN